MSFRSLIVSVGLLAAVFAVFPAVASAQVTTCNQGFASFWGINNTTCGSATLAVYVQVQNRDGVLFQNPSDFTVTVSGQNPNPSTFAGSIGGERVSIRPGSYSISVPVTRGFTPTYSTGCHGVLAPNENALCVVTMTSNATNYPYPQPYQPCLSVAPYTCTYPGQVLQCTPSVQTVAAGQPVTFTAIGGTGAYSWTTASRSFVNVGPQLNTTLTSAGAQTVTVTSGSQTATCTVTVTGVYVAPVITPIYTNTIAPSIALAQQYVVARLPNTGFAPQNGAEAAFAVALLMAAGIVTYPYIRRAFLVVAR